MNATSYLAPVLCALAFGLALAFRRHRAAMVLAAMTLAVFALSYALPSARVGARAVAAATQFLPWLWLIALAMPEPPLRSRRTLFFVALLAFAAWLVTLAPDHVWANIEAAFPLGVIDWRPARSACALSLLAAALAAVHWLRRRQPLDGVLAVALALAAMGWLELAGIGLRYWLLTATLLISLGVVHSSWRLAFLDALTGLPNRRALDETLARLSGDYALAMVDVDHFKLFNDKHGHDAGDYVLIAVARSLARTRAASAFRFGGEEFCLLFRRPELAKAACEDARLAIEQMRVELPRKPDANKPAASKSKTARKSEPRTVQVTASIGVAARNPQRRGATDIFKAADQCLYKAKGKGRNQVVAIA